MKEGAPGTDAPRPSASPTGPPDVTLEDQAREIAAPIRDQQGRSAPLADEEVVRADRYEMGSEIARGGIGRILRAHDRRLHRPVAIKELHRDDPAAIVRFLRETRITAELSHPNIIPLYEAGRWPNGQPFYAMKLVDGRTLSRAITEATSLEGRLTLLPVLVDVAEAMAYAHSRGIVHRDLKPSNILVGPFGETVVIDWGLAKHVDETEGLEAAPATVSAPLPGETSVGIVVGTPAYMPPEQATGLPVASPADVYAIGSMLYHFGWREDAVLRVLER